VVAEVADQLVLLGVHADDGQPGGGERGPPLGDVPDLLVAPRVLRPASTLLVVPQREAHPFEEFADGAVIDPKALPAEGIPKLPQAAADPGRAAHRVAGHLTGEQPLQGGGDTRLPFLDPGATPPSRPRSAAFGVHTADPPVVEVGDELGDGARLAADDRRDLRRGVAVRQCQQDLAPPHRESLPGPEAGLQLRDLVRGQGTERWRTSHSPGPPAIDDEGGLMARAAPVRQRHA
jgi:hypothetical protein